jgi:hypothetical protein
MNAGVNRYIQNICTYIINGSGHVNAKKYACQNASVIYIVIYIYTYVYMYIYMYMYICLMDCVVKYSGIQNAIQCGKLLFHVTSNSNCCGSTH